MHVHAHWYRNLRLAAWLAACSVGSTASAAILQIDASISAEVQQFDAGQPSSSDSAFEEFRTTSVNLPIQVIASVLPAVGDPMPDAFGALAVSDFRDPTLSPTANPAEFGLEANTFSLDPLVNFDASADASENRLIVFTAEELEAGEDEVDRDIDSSVFISGAVLIWTLDPTRDLSGVSVSFNVAVELEVPSASPEVVFSASASVQGQSGGDINFTATEGIEAEVGEEELLTEAVGPELAAILEQELAGLGRVHVILIPEQELTYRYVAPIDVEFNLTANISASSSNLPAGTGAGAVFGRSFEDLAQIVASFLANQSDGMATQIAINKALTDLQEQDQDPDDDGGQPTTGRGGLCAALGMELLVLPLGVAALRVGRRRGVCGHN